MPHHGDLSSLALFLDLDGSLIDIAPTPDDVVIPEGLAGVLGAATLRVDGALAILTGRPLLDIDRFLAPLAPIAAGVHGAEMRFVPSGVIERNAGPLDPVVVDAVRDLARQEPGTIVELKPASVALHYRLAPTAAARIEAALQRILDDGPDHLLLARGRQVLEIVPRHISKGAALEAIMGLPTFAGRRPVMIGDDIPDVSAFEAALRLGGSALKVAGEQFSRAEADFSGPADVRAWLAALTAGSPS